MLNHLEFLNNLRSLDFKSYVIVLNDYLENTNYENSIEDIGFNNNSGYVYLALQNGITIASNFGQNPVYFTIDSQGNEVESETYFEALEALNGNN